MEMEVISQAGRAVALTFRGALSDLFSIDESVKVN